MHVEYGFMFENLVTCKTIEAKLLTTKREENFIDLTAWCLWSLLREFSVPRLSRRKARENKVKKINIDLFMANRKQKRIYVLPSYHMACRIYFPAFNLKLFLAV